MKNIIATIALVSGGALNFTVPTSQAASFASAVVDYTPGAAVGGYTNAAAALGKPSGDTGFGVFSPFNPHFGTSQIIAIGNGGQLTLQLSNFVLVQPGLLEIGLWSNVGLVDADFPNGTATNPTTVFNPPRSSVISVSSDGVSWVALNNGTPIPLGNPGNFYANGQPQGNPPATPVDADFSKPFAGSLASFDGKTYPQILATLDGSAGGTWLDLDSTGLSQVGYVRLNGITAGETQYLDAVAINTSATGAAVPEPGTAILALFGLAGIALSSRRKP